MVLSNIKKKFKKESLNEDEKKIRKTIGALFAGNIIFIGNIPFAILRFLRDMRIQFASLRIHFILEIVFALIMIYLICKNINIIKKSHISKFSKIIYLIFVVSCMMMVLTAAWWGAFNFIS